MSHNKNPFRVFGSVAALAVLVFGFLGGCQNALDSDLSPGVEGALSVGAWPGGRLTPNDLVYTWPLLEGDWVSALYGEEFIITDTILAYEIAGWGPVFAGDIVGVTDPTAEEGYIFIQYTSSLDPDWEENYYVVKWAGFADPYNTISFSGCYDGAGRDNLQVAMDDYINYPEDDFDYFATFSDYVKATSAYRAPPLSDEKPPLLLLHEAQSGFTLEPIDSEGR
jgi:hypothetical protein